MFKDIPVGTKCFSSGRHGWRIEHIVRHTKTMVITQTPKGVEGRYCIKTGHKKGTGRWDTCTLEVFNDKHQRIVDAHTLKRKLKKELARIEVNLKSLTEEDLKLLKEVGDRG